MSKTRRVIDARRRIHLDSKAVGVRVCERPDRSGCPDRPGRFGPLNHAAIHEIGHTVPKYDTSYVVHAGHVAICQCDFLRIAVLGDDHPCQTAHTAAEFEDFSVSTQLSVFQQIVCQTFLRRPDADVAGIVEADQFVRSKILV